MFATKYRTHSDVAIYRSRASSNVMGIGAGAGGSAIVGLSRLRVAVDKPDNDRKRIIAVGNRLSIMVSK